MKVNELLGLLKTNYVEVASEENPYNVKYLLKNEVGKDILNSTVTSIEPIIFLRKQLFDQEAEDGDYVSAIKIFFSPVAADEVEYVVDEEIKEEQQKQQQREEPENPYAGFPPFGFSNNFLDNLITPEMIAEITNSDLFQTLMSPENISEIISSPEFQEFVNNSDSYSIPPYMQNVFDSLFNSAPSDSGNPDSYEEDEYDEYEEYEEYDPDDYDNY